MKQKSIRKQRDVAQSTPTDQDRPASLAAPVQQPQPAQGGSSPSDPLLLVALHASRPQLSLDDILACRCVCKAWKQRLGTAFCHTIRIPHSLWHEAASSEQLAQVVAAAAAAYPHATAVLLDAGGSRPGLPATIWQPLQQALKPWLTSSSSDSDSCSISSCSVVDSQPRQPGAGPAASNPASKQLHLRLQAPPSPCRLQALQAGLPQLSALQIQHTSQSLYSRHLAALATLTQLQSLVLTLSHPRMDLRSLTHQRTRRVPLSLDCLSSLTQLTQLELSSKGPTDELLPDTIAAFSKPASLAELSRLQSLALSEAALRGPLPAAAWVAQLPGLTKLQLVLLDEPGKGTLARGHSSSSSSRGGAATAGTATAATSGGGSAQTAAAPAGEQQHRSSTPKPPQQPLAAAAAAPGAAASSGSSSSSSGANAQHQQQRGAGSGSSGGAAGGTAPAAAAAVVPPLDLAAALPGLACLHVANVGERLVTMRIPTGLTSLAIHLSSPCPAGVTGEQLAAVVMQASSGLRQLELGLGLRFSLTGTAMRGLKRSLKQLQQLTLIEGAQDHLEGLGCWCNLASLTLVEGRCSVPLRGLYELSMRAAMGRTPGMLRYCGHVRHADELASRLGPALHQLRLDSLVGLAGGNSITGGASSGGGVVAGAAAAAAAARSVLSSSGSGGSGQFSYANAEAAEAAAAAAEVAMLQAQLLRDDAAPLAAAAAAAAAAPAAGGLVPALQQLSALTRLEVVGERLGQLDFAAAAVLSGLSRLVVLEVVGGEPWLQPALGVKEQLVWVSGLRGLRRMRLGGVMLGRSRLAGETSRSSSTAGAATAAASVAAKGNTGSSKAGSGGGMLAAHGGMPAVKGLGNGLAYAGGSCSAGRQAAAAAGATGAGAMPDPAAAAAARDVVAALCLEELRRWLADLLPHARVWLD